MDERPVTRYAKAPDGVSLAYQVTGDGPVDLMFLPAYQFPIDLTWDEPGFVRMATRLGRFSRTVWREHRGTGASAGNLRDCHVGDIADADITTVLDAAECHRAVLVGASSGGPTAIHYAATHPERVAALILIGTHAHYLREDDYPFGVPLELLEQFSISLLEDSGPGAWMELVAPSKAEDEKFRTWWARAQSLGNTDDKRVGFLVSSCRQDVRSLLSTLSVPTLVLHRQGDRLIRVGAGRYLADRIPGAKYVELLGDDNVFFVGDTDPLFDEIEEFLTGDRQAPEGDVVTTTILFTDIVASTEQSARLGHRKWTALTDAHDTMVRSVLNRHRGREIKNIGDGFLATFDATTRAVRAAMEIVTQAKNMGLEVRAGVHIGEVEVRPDDVVGLTVSIAKRICDLAGPGEVFVSEGVKVLIVGSGIDLNEQGTHVLKGVPNEWLLFSAVDQSE